jgi:HEAT repeat protein
MDINFEPPPKITIHQLLEALLNESKILHPRYLYRLSDLQPQEVNQLEKIWPRVSVSRRQALMEDLEELGEADDLLDFIGVCRIALKDDEAEVRRLAVQILRNYESQDLIPIFLTMMEDDSQVSVRAAASAALGSFVYLGEIEELPGKTLRGIEACLLRVTTGPDESLVRRRALEALGFSCREEVPSLIEAAYASKDKDWLVSALCAMGHSADERWNDKVLESLDNPRPDVRIEAIAAAGELELQEATKPLLRFLRDDNDDVRAAAIWALSQIGGEGVQDALEALFELTEDEDEAELLENALDNLAFTEDVRSFSILEIGDERPDLFEGGDAGPEDEDDDL